MYIYIYRYMYVYIYIYIFLHLINCLFPKTCTMHCFVEMFRRFASFSTLRYPTVNGPTCEFVHSLMAFPNQLSLVGDKLPSSTGAGNSRPSVELLGDHIFSDQFWGVGHFEQRP